ncbi:hypothetical protein A1O1_07014 [Capronia coronata CBS 617.96]|uniref:Xylanolytic transcriptional activator regulatory domain-containing protein n=1 Tax=Capronia coronata CBS 617.96 TaxID=1182541 RepID=W9XS83_9EURO|nr:uncharacterized protein A1O1_07014 [Capronia coronata CBS 617.96]EXJ83392.1 hypothetical protein A1O1_07014 [Capronia coronata CBS 617.96]
MLLTHSSYSLVRSLEARVAELEAQVRAYRDVPQNMPYLMASEISQATLSFGIPSSRSYLRSRLSAALIFRPSCPPLALVREREHDASEKENPAPTPNIHRELSGTTTQSKQTLLNLNSVPISAIRRMVQNYADIILPQYPCVSETALHEIVESLQNEELRDTNSVLVYGIPPTSRLGHFEYFIFFIVLAISAITLTWKAEDQARTASESFYNSALRHLQALNNPDDMQALQVSLLLAHYAQMSPERADNWTCIANAVRIVLDLGLHRQSPDWFTTEQISMRSRLFWVIYGMERSLCSNLRLPLSFPEEAITATFEASVPDEAAVSSTTLDELERKSSANHIYRYRALETEVHRVLHLEDDLSIFGQPDMDSWIRDISERLVLWYEKAQTYTRYNMLEFKQVQYHHLRARIHRPTPRLRVRSPEDRRIVLEASLRLIEDYTGQVRRRRLFYPWHGVHILFEAAVIALEACWSSRDWEPLRAQAKEMLQESLPQCFQALTYISKWWNEAAVCVNRLAPLTEKIASVFAGGNSMLLSSYEDSSITEEIQRLLFSDGPLTWNQAPHADPLWDIDDNFPIFDNTAFNDTNLFQWDPEWDFMPMNDDSSQISLEGTVLPAADGTMP